MNTATSRKSRSAFFTLIMLAMAGWLSVQAANYGLSIGINKYSYGPGNLNACINDANGIRNSLLADTTHWQAGTLSLVTDGTATKANIRTLLQQLAATAVSGDVVVYFQSSHGGQNSGTSVYLCMYDADYQATELAADLAQFQAGVKVIIIIDACHSGGLFRDADGNPTWQFAETVMRYYDEIQREQGTSRAPSIGWMTACDYYQTSLENTQNGFFAGNVINGFIAANTNAGGYVTFGNLFDYAYPRTVAANPNQTPQTYNRAVLDATAAIGTYVPPVAHTNTVSAYVNAYYGKLYIDYAYTTYGSSDTNGFLVAARDYAAYAFTYAYYAYAYDVTYGSDYGYASYACQCAYYANKYASFAYAYGTADAYSYYGSLYEYNAYYYSSLVAIGQR